MAQEVAYAGVHDAVTGEYLSGTADPALVKLAKDGPVLAAPGDNDNWVAVEEGTVLLPSGARKVTVNVTHKTGGTS